MNVFKKVTLPSRLREILNARKTMSEALDYITFSNRKNLIDTVAFFGCFDKDLLGKKLKHVPEKFDLPTSFRSIINHGPFSIETRDQLITAGEVLVSTVHSLGLEFKGGIVAVSNSNKGGNLDMKLKDVNSDEEVIMSFDQWGSQLSVIYPELEKSYIKHSIYTYKNDHNFRDYCFYSRKSWGSDLYDVSLSPYQEIKTKEMPDGSKYTFAKEFILPDNAPPKYFYKKYCYLLKYGLAELSVSIDSDTIVDADALDKAFTTLRVNNSIFDNLDLIGKNYVLTSSPVSMSIRRSVSIKSPENATGRQVIHDLKVIKGNLTSCKIDDLKEGGQLQINQDGSWNWSNQGENYNYSVESDSSGKLSNVSITAEKDGIDTSVGVKGVVDTATKAYQKTIGAMPSWIKRN